MALFVASVIERIAADERIRELAFTDALTGLPNRVLWADRTALAVATAKRYGQGFAVMYIDIDLFKSVNDAFGHHVGDEFLRAAAARLRSTLRESDTLARFGGDEFVILQTMVTKAVRRLRSGAKGEGRDAATDPGGRPRIHDSLEYRHRVLPGGLHERRDADAIGRRSALPREGAKGGTGGALPSEELDDPALNGSAVPNRPEAAE